MGRRLWLFFFVFVPLVLISSFYILAPQLATDRFVEFIRDILEPLTMSQQFQNILPDCSSVPAGVDCTTIEG